MALVLVAFAVVAVFVTVWFPVRERISALDALQRKATNQAELVAYTIAPAVEFGDTHLVEEVFRGAARDADFVGIEARDSDGQRVGTYGDLSRSSAHSFVLANARIDMQTAGAGQVHLVMSTRRIDETSREQTLISITIGLTILALGFAISVRIGRSTREITALMEENARQRSAAERANEVKTRFLANMSHEMRTPLNGVLGLADVLSRYPLDERARGLVRVISRSGRTLLMLVNDILDLSRVEADRLELESAPFDPESIVMSVCEMFVPACREKGLELIARVGAEVPREFEGDRLRVEQVLTNLVGNAVKFTASGRVVVQLAWEDGPEVSALRLSVRDTGIGVAAAKLDVIFDAFSQADTSTTRRFGGSGLGLAISRSLVRRMDGDLTVQSVEGAGSTFTFNVPGRASAPAPTVVASDFPPLVAIASADPEVRSALREQAKRCGVECRDIEASSADIDGLPAGTALIWDAAMPTGEPAVRRALERASSERDIRLVAHAAMIDEPPFGALMPQVLSKPCSRDAFERAVGSRGGTREE